MFKTLRSLTESRKLSLDCDPKTVCLSVTYTNRSPRGTETVPGRAAGASCRFFKDTEGDLPHHGFPLRMEHRCVKLQSKAKVVNISQGFQ